MVHHDLTDTDDSTDTENINEQITVTTDAEYTGPEPSLTVECKDIFTEKKPVVGLEFSTEFTKPTLVHKALYHRSMVTEAVNRCAVTEEDGTEWIDLVEAFQRLRTIADREPYIDQIIITDYMTPEVNEFEIDVDVDV